MLELARLSKAFGGVRAVDELTLDLPRGAVFGLIGPNGSGKTTIINLISGLYTPTSGEILFEGGKIGGMPSHRIVRRGIARTFQNMRLFSELSVEDNIRVFQAPHTRKIADWLGTRQMSGNSPLHEKVEELLHKLALTKLRREMAGNLSLGEQKRLEIARALATEPSLLLLDEPAGGMSFQEIKALGELLRNLVAQGLTIMLVEHNMRFVMAIAQRIAVLNFGRLIACGSPQEVRSNRTVIEAYLGNE